MGISLAIHRAHVEHWEPVLKRSHRPHRSNWPTRLFRHEQLENAAKIMRDGALRSRDAADIVRDIAPEEIIDLNPDAHQYARLYFRPRTPTQFRIEGARAANEIYGNRHAPTLCMFLFSSEGILTRPDVQFSDGNMQSQYTNLLQGDAGFAQIDFSKVYHEGPFNKDDPANADLIRSRCAEVLCPNPLDLDENLQAVICRSHAERQTLIHLLGDRATDWAKKIRIFSEAGLFCNDYSYVESVDITEGGLKVKFHPPKSTKDVNVEVWCKGMGPDLPSRHWERRPRNIGKPWNFTTSKLPNGRYKVKINIEDEVVFKSLMNLSTGLF